MGKRLSPDQREKLPKSDFACPLTREYPIHDKPRVASAKSYYRRKYTAKCPSGRVRICRRARKFGMLKKEYSGSADWRKWCR